MERSQLIGGQVPARSLRCVSQHPPSQFQMLSLGTLSTLGCGGQSLMRARRVLLPQDGPARQDDEGSGYGSVGLLRGPDAGAPVGSGCV